MTSKMDIYQRQTLLEKQVLCLTMPWAKQVNKHQLRTMVVIYSSETWHINSSKENHEKSVTEILANFNYLAFRYSLPLLNESPGLAT